MRDSVIQIGMTGLERKITHDFTILHNNLTITRTRIDAMESALFVGRFTLLRAVILSIFHPKKLRAEVDRWHQWHLRDYQNKVAELEANRK